MKTKTKTKISKTQKLKARLRSKRLWREYFIKSVFKPATVLACIVWLVIASHTGNAQEVIRPVLPVHEDKAELSIWDRVEIKINHLSSLEKEEIRCTLWEESIKIFKENSEIAYNAYKNKPAGSLDRGIAMYNSYWRADVSDTCAFNFDCAMDNMLKDFKAGKKRSWYGYRTCQNNNFKY